ncbi:MAG TPA: NrsF family protein [Polyangiales bacterium]|nr:NrsF family protein [Polyangiales bacterium]
MSTEPDLTDLNFGDIPDPAAAVTTAPRAPLLTEKAAPRSAARNQRWAALILSLFWFGSHLFVYGLREDLRALPPLYVLVQIALPLVLALLSLIVATHAGKRGLGLHVGLLSLLALLGPLSFWLMAVGAPAPRSEQPETWLNAFLCLDITLSWAAVPLLCGALVLRRAFPAASVWRSALLGSACGLFAGGIMNLHCANVSRLHLIAGHGLPVLVSALIGALLVRQLARS